MHGPMRLDLIPRAIATSSPAVALLGLALLPIGAGTTLAAEAPPAASALVVMPGDLPVALRERDGRHLVLQRRLRRLLVLEDGIVAHHFPVAVGMPGWETPAGSFEVLEMRQQPVWEHPENGELTQAGPQNPLGSRWIGFHRDCDGRQGWDGERVLDVKGCVVMGFHGTPHRWTVGRAVSHGCVRLYDEHVQELFDLVEVGTSVTVLE